MMLYRQSSADPVQPGFERRLQQQAGRNQEVNSRLQTKADELERLFAEHKRRARRHRGEAEEGSGENNSEERPTIGCSSRGELYERYMQKRRESKLRREWGMERAAAMKALRESLERSGAELKLLNLRSSATMKRGRDQLVKNNFSEKEEEEDEQSDTSYKSVNPKLLPTKRTMSSSSSVGRNSNSSLNRAIPRPSSATATATGNSARGSGSKNTSDTRKENTKPSMSIVGSKPSTNLPRSKSTSAGLSSSSSSSSSTSTSTPSRKSSATPLKPLTVLPASTASTSGRARKKWASVVAGPDASCQPPRKDTGIKRFLQFGRKKKLGAESAGVGGECSPAAGARGDGEDGTAASEVVMSKSRLEYHVSCCDGAMALEQGVPRSSFFSLPPFRNREGDSKLGR